MAVDENMITEKQRVALRKKKVCEIIFNKFHEDAWQKRLLTIAGRGGEGRILKAINSFLSYIANDTGGSSNKKRYAADATISSLCQVFLEAFQLDVELGGGRDLAAIIVYDKQAELDISYKGFVHILNKHFDNAFVNAGLVFEGDEFTSEETDNWATYHHKPLDQFPTVSKDFENVKGAFCYFSYTLPESGEKVSRLVRMSRNQIMMIRSKAKQHYVWDDFPEEMAKKAVYRRAAKVPFAMIDFDDDINVEEIDNRHYQIENQSGSQERLKLLMAKQLELVGDGEPSEEEPEDNPLDISGDTLGDTSEQKNSENANQPMDEERVSLVPDGVLPNSAQEERVPTQVSELEQSGEENNVSSNVGASRAESNSIELGAAGRDITDADFEEVDGESTVTTSTETVRNTDAPPQWDGRSIWINGRIQEHEFATPAQAAIHLKGCMGAIPNKEGRLYLIQKNQLLINRLIKDGNQKMIDELHKVAGEVK